MKSVELNINNHSRDSAGLRYVYPVISRRAGGVSIGINLNTNNACNWRCVYCQVPDLKLGTAPPVELDVLEIELRGFLHGIIHGDYMQNHVPVGARRINDIALSGNGEPTSAKAFEQVIELVGKLKSELALPQEVKLVLISNGSLMHRPSVQRGLRLMEKLNGEVWFKVDRANTGAMQLVNNTEIGIVKARQNLLTSVALCPTWLQTCWFSLDGLSASKQDEDDYLEFISGLLLENVALQGVLLYGLARPSLQAEASRLKALSEAQIEAFAVRIRALGLRVKVSV